MTVIKCDRCRMEITGREAHDANHVKFTPMFSEGGLGSSAILSRPGLDLCGPCVKQVKSDIQEYSNRPTCARQS